MPKKQYAPLTAEERAEAETAGREAVEPGTAAETTVNGKASEVSSEGGESSSSSLPPIIISDLTVLTDGQLFLCLRDLIENERLYLQPDFGRQTLIEHTGLSKERVGQLIKRYGGVGNLQVYVNRKRAAYAKGLMRSHVNYTMEAIANECGIGNLSTFYRIFKQVFGVSPAEFRRSLADGAGGE